MATKRFSIETLLLKHSTAEPSYRRQQKKSGKNSEKKYRYLKNFKTTDKRVPLWDDKDKPTGIQ